MILVLCYGMGVFSLHCKRAPIIFIIYAETLHWPPQSIINALDEEMDISPFICHWNTRQEARNTAEMGCQFFHHIASVTNRS